LKKKEGIERDGENFEREQWETMNNGRKWERGAWNFMPFIFILKFFYSQNFLQRS